MSGPEKAPCFYISSFGGSASGWLASVLSMHPDIVCFHGTRSIPPTPSGIHDLDPDAFVAGLMECARASQYQKAFGAAHGYEGVMALEAIRKKKGYFGAILRDPIRRIHSLFSEYYYNHYTTYNVNPTCYEGKDIYENIKQNQEMHIDLGDIFRSANEQLTNCEQLFLMLCRGTVKNDLECVEHIERENIFKMERFTTDIDYFKNMFCKIVSYQIIPTEAYIHRVFNFGNYNQHSKYCVNSYDLYKMWPESFKIIFMMMLILSGLENVINMYESFGYRIPCHRKDLDLLRSTISLDVRVSP